MAVWSPREVRCPTPSVSPGSAARSGRTCPGPGLGGPQVRLAEGGSCFPGLLRARVCVCGFTGFSSFNRTEPGGRVTVLLCLHFTLGKRTQATEQAVCSTSQRLSGGPCTASGDRREGDRRERLSFLSPATASPCQNTSSRFGVTQNVSDRRACQSHGHTHRFFALSPQIAGVPRKDRQRALPPGSAPFTGCQHARPSEVKAHANALQKRK